MFKKIIYAFLIGLFLVVPIASAQEDLSSNPNSTNAGASQQSQTETSNNKLDQVKVWSQDCFAYPSGIPKNQIWFYHDKPYIIDHDAVESNLLCTCKPGYTRKSLLLQTQDGQNPIPYHITHCVPCDLEQCNCGIKLNTDIPFIGSCIMYGEVNQTTFAGQATVVDATNAFPILLSAIIRLMMGLILLTCLGAVIVGGFLMTVEGQYKTGLNYVKKVVWIIIMIGSLGLILYLINPNFFR